MTSASLSKVKGFIEKDLLPLDDFPKTNAMFKTYKQYENGGKILVPNNIDKKASDYKHLISIAIFFAKEGKTVRLNPVLHFKSDEYKQIFGSLTGTLYECKCPDLLINSLFYEFESYIPPYKKRKMANMISHGTKQSSHIIINNNKGASDRFIRRSVFDRLDDKNFRYDIEELWVYEKGNLRLLFKKQ